MTNNNADEWVRQLEPAARDWLDAVATSGVSEEAWKVAAVLAQRMNGALIASLSMRDIARCADMPRTRYSDHSETAAREAINELVPAYLEKRCHPGYANEYAAVVAEFVPEEFYAWLDANRRGAS